MTIEELPQEKFQDKYSGCVFDTREEAINQAIEYVAGELLASLKCEGSNYLDSVENLIAVKSDIIQEATVLIGLLKNPDKHIVKYSRK